MASANPAHILIVDDDTVSGEAMANLLRREGHDVLQVPDYELALKRLEAAEPLDLLLTDIVMPNRVNGVALSRMARLRRPHVKILYMTGYDIPGVEDEALGPILRKPISDERLLAEVERVLVA